MGKGIKKQVEKSLDRQGALWLPLLGDSSIPGHAAG
jgi:hypothetical protein